LGAANRTMSAVMFEEPGHITLIERPVPEFRGPSDVLVDLVATGICGTDRGIVLGEFPATRGVILGHEAVGLVAATGPEVGDMTPGDRVVINPTFWCGRCSRCVRGGAAYCMAKDGREIGVDTDGTMTRSIVLEERFVHRLPAGMAWARAALIEPLACVLNNLAAANLQLDDHVLITGAGPIGALCALVLAHRGLKVRVAERDLNRLGLARSLLPTAVGLVAVTGSLAESLAAADAEPDVVIDTTGVLLEEALGVVAVGGRIVVMGERQAAVGQVPLRLLATRGVQVVGAGPYSPPTFQLALDLAPDLPLESIVSHAFPLEDYREAFGMLGLGGGGWPAGGYRAMKVLLVSDPTAMTVTGPCQTVEA